MISATCLKYFLICFVFLLFLSSSTNAFNNKKKVFNDVELAEVGTPANSDLLPDSQIIQNPERIDDSDSNSLETNGDDDSESSEEAGCSSTPLGCFGTHRALHSIIPILVCCCIGAG